MKKTIILLMLTLFCYQNSKAQCSTQLTTLGNNIAPLAERIGQSFQVDCNGTLNDIVFTPTGGYIDTFGPNDNVVVGLRLRDASGTFIANGLINGQNTINSWGPNNTYTFSFTSSNVNLTANTTYSWELYGIELFSNGPIGLLLLERSNSNPYTNGNAIFDSTNFPNADLHGWTVNVSAPPCTNPTITSTMPSSNCGAGNITLSATPSAGNVQWFADATGGIALTNNAQYTISGNSITLNNLASTTTLYAEAVDGSCVSAERTAITATINLAPTTFEVNGINYNVTSATTVEVGSNTTATGAIVIPETVTNACGTYTVTSIGTNAFYSNATGGATGLTSVTLPNTIINIGAQSFRACTSLTSINIPNSVTNIGNGAFNSCTALTAISIPDSVTSIGNQGFNGCTSLSSVSLSNSLTTLNSDLFRSCTSLTSIVIPNSVTTMSNAFQNCINLSSVTLSNSLTNLTTGTFSGCTSLTSISLPNSLTNIGNSVFNGCTSLSSINLPNALTSISNSAFRSTQIPSVTIPSTVSFISSDAFRSCTALTSVTLLSTSSISFGVRVFQDCTALTSVTVAAPSPFMIDASTFQNVTVANATLNVPTGSATAYQAAPVWQNFGTIIAAPAPQLNAFTLASGTQLVSSGNVSINYNGGTLTNNGTLTNTNGSLAFTSPVTFEGMGTTTTNNLRIQHAGTSQLNNRIQVRGNVQVNNGNLDANNNLTLLSNASGSAVIAPVAAGSNITGKVTVQRFIPQGKRAFRFLTPGVTTDDFIANNWQLATHITGSTSGANGFDQTVSGNPSMFVYNNQQAAGSGWAPIANTDATNLQVGHGYRLLVRGDRTPTNITAASLPNMNTAVTLAATGTVAVGTVTLNASSDPAINNTTNTTTNGFSLIGNPYVNTVNWNDLTKTGLTDAYYAWDANMGTAAQRGRYVVFSTALGTNNMASAVNEFIQPGQAFFVKNTALGTAGSITFNEVNKVGGSSISNQVFSTPATLSRIDLQVYETNELALSGYPIDAAVAVFSPSFSNEIDALDIDKLSTGTENIAFKNQNKNFAIETRALVTPTDELQIDLNEFVANKNYSFKTIFSDFDTNATPYLVDTYLNEVTALNNNQATIHHFQTNNEAASFANNRFKIVFQNTPLSNPEFNENALVLYPNPVTNGQFHISLPTNMTGEVTVSIKNLLGQTVYESKVDATPTIAIQTNQKLAQALYVVTITNNGKSVSKKITVK